MLRFTPKCRLLATVALAIGCVAGCNSKAGPASEQADETASQEATQQQASQQQDDSEDVELLERFGGRSEPPKLPPPVGASAMPKPNRTWIDAERGVVLVDGYVSLREGMLEMFACPAGTKEHESVVAVYSWAQVVHAALLAVGAETGTPVQFDPEFQPPTGTQIDIEVRWLDEAGKWQSAKAQDWVKDVFTGKPMAHPWVFAGSGFWKDEETGQEHYMAEAGDFICVSNFSTATLDIPVESSQVNEGLLFEAFTEKIPPLGTPVRLVLKPKLEEAATED
ncbi:MAG: hypothetical protein IH898_14380 [Planctomycetes bacterium]|nr:hypothetical protein [Planctomycetota bacterium]